ncbi:MAG: hypothetical protein NC827_08625 [Candidatus Omnitrophica bacterium]|nr:hypothetical protein [Candidatus Omnitrophota bacterium]MCM8803351.1 hypothetical protein [Candidatus Omnitrophota bacterium]
MVKNRKLLEEFEKGFIRNSKIDVNTNIEIFEQLLKFATSLKKFPPHNLLEDIDIDIKYARVINGIKRVY